MRHFVNHANHAIAAALGVLLAAQAALAGPSSTSVTYGPASATRPGIVTTGAQTFAGAKTFNGDATFSDQVGVGGAPAAGAQHTVVHDSGTNDAYRTQDTRAAVARVWVSGPNVGINNTYTFRDATGSANILSLGTSATGGDVTARAGNLVVAVAGKGLAVAEGSNARMGAVALVAGSATVSTTATTANSRILLTSQVDGGTPGWLRVSARSPGTSFTITSSDASDTSTVAWLIVEPS